MADAANPGSGDHSSGIGADTRFVHFTKCNKDAERCAYDGLTFFR